MLNAILGTIRILTNIDGLNFAAVNGIQCMDVQEDECGISFSIPLYLYLRIKRSFGLNGIPFKLMGASGVSWFIYKMRSRVGLLLGIIFMFLLLSVCGKYIWSFEVIGNETISDSEIIGILSELGCGIGAKTADINFDLLHNEFLLRCDGVSWISVNVVGSTANVEIMEVKKGGEEYESGNNVVASEDGQINLITVENGKSQVKIGDVVKRGDILISGVETYREGENTYYGFANGKVLASVNRRFRVGVEQKEFIKVYSGEQKTKFNINFFGFSLNLLSNSGILYDKYDTIVENSQLVLFGSVELPIWLESARYCEYTYEEHRLSEEEIKAKAIKEYRKKLIETTADAELVSISAVHNYVDGVYSIECDIYCIADIASDMPFTIVE